MKKIIICLSFIISAVLMQACNERTESKMKGNTPASDVPAAVTSAFNAKYQSVTDVEWDKETQNNQLSFEAEFKQNGKELKAKFDTNGTFISEKND